MALESLRTQILPTKRGTNRKLEQNMKTLTGFTERRLTLTVVTVASIALISGCCNKRERQSSYYSNPAYSGASFQEEQAPATTAESPNLVVPLFRESINVGKREVDAGSVR